MPTKNKTEKIKEEIFEEIFDDYEKQIDMEERKRRHFKKSANK